MTDKPDFILVLDDAPPPAPVRTGGLLARLKTKVTTAITSRRGRPPGIDPCRAAGRGRRTTRPRLVFAVDATASREPAWTPRGR